MFLPLILIKLNFILFYVLAHALYRARYESFVFLAHTTTPRFRSWIEKNRRVWSNWSSNPFCWAVVPASLWYISSISMSTKFGRLVPLVFSKRGFSTSTSIQKGGSEEGLKSLNLCSAINQALHIALDTDPRWVSQFIYLLRRYLVRGDKSKSWSYIFIHMIKNFLCFNLNHQFQLLVQIHFFQDLIWCHLSPYLYRLL